LWPIISIFSASLSYDENSKDYNNQHPLLLSTEMLNWASSFTSLLFSTPNSIGYIITTGYQQTPINTPFSGRPSHYLRELQLTTGLFRTRFMNTEAKLDALYTIGTVSLMEFQQCSLGPAIMK
jgi:hypothetical protein